MAVRRRHKTIDKTKLVLILLVITLMSVVVAHSSYLQDIQERIPKIPTVFVYVDDSTAPDLEPKETNRGEQT